MDLSDRPDSDTKAPQAAAVEKPKRTSKRKRSSRGAWAKKRFPRPYRKPWALWEYCQRCGTRSPETARYVYVEGDDPDYGYWFPAPDRGGFGWPRVFCKGCVLQLGAEWRDDQ